MSFFIVISNEFAIVFLETMLLYFLFLEILFSLINLLETELVYQSNLN